MGKGNEAVRVLLLMLPQVGCHRAQIVAKLFGILLSDASDFINDGVVLHGYSSINSSGVQITGQA